LEGKGRGRVGEKEYQNLLARIRFANAVIAQKSFNWLQLLDRLESVVPDGVAMTSIEPDLKGGGVKLAGVARSFAELRRFAENLEGSKFFTEVYLLGNAERKISESQKGMNFTITCKVASL
jgi:type IV pilus assembly protein PilN